jgi:zinc transport system ATP-binding protein
MVEPVISVEHLDFSRGELPVLRDASLEVYPRDFVGLVGANGSGKTTFLQILLGLLTPEAGTVRVLGTTPQQARKQMGYVPQWLRFDPDFPVTVMEVVMMGLLSRSTGLGGFRHQDRRRALEALEETEIADLAQRQIGKLSGGQRQRVLIARALVNEPKLLLLDEPTANVDSRMEAGIYELLHGLRNKTTIVLVSHDVGFITSHANRVACLNRNIVCHPTAELSGEMITKLYSGPIEMIKHECALCQSEEEEARQ